jgi:hypothetical protein
MRALGVVAAVLCLAGPVDASGPTYGYENPLDHGGAKIRPTRVTFDQDGNDTVTGLRYWQGWGTDHAASSGTLHRNDCLPNCAEGQIRLYNTTVYLSRPRVIHGRRVYRCYRLAQGSHYCV